MKKYYTKQEYNKLLNKLFVVIETSLIDNLEYGELASTKIMKEVRTELKNMITEIIKSINIEYKEKTKHRGNDKFYLE